MSAIQVGIRELQVGMARVIERVEDGQAVIVTRYRRPIGVLLPVSLAPGWVLVNRPLDDLDPLADPASWSVELGVRIAPGADRIPVRGSVRGRLLRSVRLLHGQGLVGRVAVPVGLGQLWALVDLNGEDLPAVLRVEQRRALERGGGGGGGGGAGRPGD